MSSPTLYQMVIDNPSEYKFYVSDDPNYPNGAVFTVDENRTISFVECCYIQRLETPANIALPPKQQVDVLGNVLEQYGRAKYPVTVGNNGMVNADTATVLSFTDLTGITITESLGTATPTIVGNTIIWTNGTVLKLTLSNGSVYTMSEVDGLEEYDRVNDLHALWTGTLLTDHRDFSNAQYPYNMVNGCDVWQNGATSDFKYVPLKLDGTSILTDGDTLTGYTWIRKAIGSTKVLNGCEQELIEEPANQLRLIDNQLDTQIMFEVNGNPTPYTQSVIEPDQDDKGLVFARIDDSNIDRITKYEAPQTGDNLQDVLIYTNSITPYLLGDGSQAIPTVYVHREI